MLRSFLPQSFGAKKQKLDVSEKLNETKRTKRVTLVRKRKITDEDADGTEEQTSESGISVSEASKAIITDEGQSLLGKKGYVVIGPPKPKTRIVEEIEEVEVEEEDTETSEYDKLLPVSHEIKLKGHTKAITALALDTGGARLLTGSNDYMVRFWDFAGMDSAHRSFRDVEPHSGHQVRSLSYSINGDQFLVTTGNAKAKIYSRDGHEIAECARGDMYLLDMGNTKGHVAALTQGVWHPTDPNTFMTSAADSTVRLWDANDVTKQKTVIKFRDARNTTRLPVSGCTFSPDGSLIAGGGEDGSVWIWPTKGPYARPKQMLRNAHGGDISCLTFSKDGYTLLTRAQDDTVKVWDTRNLKQAVHTMSDLVSFGNTDVIFSPDEQFIVTGTSVKKGEGTASLVFFDRKTGEKVRQIAVAGGSVNRLLWHPKLNQIIAGCGDAVARVYYDPMRSTNGALLSVYKQKRRKDPSDSIQHFAIHTPHALPMFKDQPSAKKQRLKDRQDPVKSRKPDLPLNGPGHAGHVGSSLTHHMMKTLIKKTEREVDPREAILKYAQEAEADPYWFRAYKDTQPAPIFNHEALRQEAEEEKKKAEEAEKKKRRG